VGLREVYVPLKTCPDCKSQVSDRAPHCPKCGRPIAERDKQRKQAIILIAALVMAAFYVFKMYYLDPREMERMHQEAFETQDRYISNLLSGLQRQPGKFESTPDSGWLFRGNPTLMNRLEDYGEAALTRLIDCVDSTEPAKITADNQAVPFGVLCATALLRFVDLGEYDLPPDWPGYIEPTATAVELQQAKAAWQEVAAAGWYTLRDNFP